MTRPLLSICIVTYNTSTLLSRCLSSIYSTVSVPFEVIVVDNGSTDETVSLLISSYPKVHVIRNKRNVYFSQAYNQAMKRSKGSYLLLLNSDIVLRKTTVSSFLSYITDHSESGLLSCRHILPNGTTDPTCSLTPTPFIDFLESHFLGQLVPFRKYFLSHFRYSSWNRQTNRMVDILPGSVLFFPRVILSRVGFFDASMKLFYSDTDFSIRVRKSHYAVVHIGTTSVLHIRQATTKLLSSTTTNSLWKHDKQRFYTKYYGSIVGFLSSFPL